MGQLHFSDRMVAGFVLIGAILSTGFMLYGHVIDPEKTPIGWVIAGSLGGAVFGLLIFGATMPFIAWYKLSRNQGASPLRAIYRIVLAFLLAAIPIAIYMAANHWLPWLFALIFIVGLPFTIMDIVRARRLRTIYPRSGNLPVRRD